ncbi:von Hippel-Lindau disease tumor suppressor-like [Tubulanus polymorphus]|uniref:von Hippel-Lindau disease tumor suppressor-like n=1 Tax=Tubulanus polymorphus TaxID=672921 RepID=UPI003DA48169
MSGGVGGAVGVGAVGAIAAPPKSGRPTVYSFVRFINKTQRKVDVIWLNYAGDQMNYASLNPEQFLDMNTYVGHPWIFKDTESGDKLVVQHQKLYQPIGWLPSDGWPPQRKRVYITIPVYSLKERCLQIIRCLTPQNSIPSLELPQSLINELLCNT